MLIRKTEVLRLVIFFILATLAIYWNSPLAIFSYLLLITVCLSPIIFKDISKKYYLISLTLFIFGIVVYGILARYINAIELWGDEIGVIEIAEGRFQDIVQGISSLHAAVPPLDYWNMWFWKYIVKPFPARYMEFLYRVPYMALHVAGGILFAFACVGKKRASDTANRYWYKLYWAVLVTAFLTYFFNPLLFFYSIEVRFFILAAAGISLVLLLYRRGELGRLKYFPLLLLLGLNSIYQLIVLPLFFIAYYLTGRERKNAVLMVGSIIILSLIIWPILLIPSPVSQKESLELIRQAIYQFYNLQLESWPQVVPIGIIMGVAIWRSYKDRHLQGVLLVLIGGFWIITGASYIKGYFDFYPRHYLFLIPLILYLIFYIPEQLGQRFGFGMLFLIVVFMTLPWLSTDIYRLKTKMSFSKAYIGSKEVMEYAESGNHPIIVLPNTEGKNYTPGYDFSVKSIRWYAKSYRWVKVIYPETTEEACEAFSKNRNTILYSFFETVPCFAVKRHIYGAVLGLH